MQSSQLPAAVKVQQKQQHQQTRAAAAAAAAAAAKGLQLEHVTSAWTIQS
jgi:hypothetical protein